MLLTDKAMKFASKCHEHQKYGDYSYDEHLHNVFEILYTMEEYKDDSNLLSSAILHDVCEDCGVQYDELKNEFNDEIAFNVWCVSDCEGESRNIIKSKTYLKIKTNPKAIIIKLADRISNIKYSINYRETSKRFLKMYKEEHVLFKWNLYVPSHAEKLWLRLDKLIEII